VNLRAALVIREAEALQDVEIPVLSAQALREEQEMMKKEEKRKQEKTRY